MRLVADDGVAARHVVQLVEQRGEPHLDAPQAGKGTVDTVRYDRFHVLEETMFEIKSNERKEFLHVPSYFYRKLPQCG